MYHDLTCRHSHELITPRRSSIASRPLSISSARRDCATTALAAAARVAEVAICASRRGPGFELTGFSAVRPRVRRGVGRLGIEIVGDELLKPRGLLDQIKLDDAVEYAALRRLTQASQDAGRGSGVSALNSSLVATSSSVRREFAYDLFDKSGGRSRDLHLCRAGAASSTQRRRIVRAPSMMCAHGRRVKRSSRNQRVRAISASTRARFTVVSINFLLASLLNAFRLPARKADGMIAPPLQARIRGYLKSTMRFRHRRTSPLESAPERMQQSSVF